MVGIVKVYHQQCSIYYGKKRTLVKLSIFFPSLKVICKVSGIKCKVLMFFIVYSKKGKNIEPLLSHLKSFTRKLKFDELEEKTRKGPTDKSVNTSESNNTCYIFFRKKARWRNWKRLRRRKSMDDPRNGPKIIDRTWRKTVVHQEIRNFLKTFLDRKQHQWK